MSQEPTGIIKSTNSFPSICGIHFSPVESITSIARGTDAFHKEVTFSGSLDWLSVYFTKGFAEFTEVQKEDDAGAIFNQELKLMFPGEDVENKDINAVIGRPVIVRIDYNHGKSKIIGNLSNPARFVRDLSTGIKSSGYQLRFTCSSPDPAFWLDIA